MAEKKAKAKARHYTDKERIARVKRHLDPWASFMGLSQTWHIEVTMANDGNEGAWASVTMTYPYPKAVIQVNRKGLDSIVDYEVEVLVIHELLHILAQSHLGAIVATRTPADRLRQDFENGMEAFIDSLARIIACLHNDKYLGPRYVKGGAR